MMNKSVYLIFLVAVAAGCIGGTQTATVDPSNGLVINSFSATPSQLFDNDPAGVLLEIEVENVGGTDARNVMIDVLGVEGQWRDSQGNVLTDTLTKDIGTMRRPIPERNLPGKIVNELFTIRPPDIGQGVSPSISIEGRVTYDYNTSGFIDLLIMSEQKFQESQITGQPLPVPVTVQNSAGPIHMTVPARFVTPLIVDTNVFDDQRQTVRIELVNVGRGFPITPETQAIGAGGRILGTIELLGPNGVEFSDCLNLGGGTLIDLGDVDLRIRETNSVPIACELSIDPSILSQTRPTERVKLIFNLEYTYFVSAAQAVQVIGR
jgi:hypothetical protein